MDNPEKLTTQGTQDENKRQRIPKGQSKNGQSRETDNIGHTRRE